jgi:hypothetical protein
LRADSHYCCPEVLDFCRANGLDYILGVAPTSTLRRRVADLEASTKAKFEATSKDGKLRRFKEFLDGAQSRKRVERIIARVEVGAEGPDTRFVVTNLTKGNARRLYEDLYCRRGQAENHIKSWEDTSGGGSDVLHESDRQSVSAVPSRRRLLVDVGLSRLDAEAFDVARRSVRHVATATHQDRRSRRRNEDDDTSSPADIVPSAEHIALRSGAHSTPRHMTDGA